MKTYLLTEDQIDSVFYLMENDFDAGVGMNWDIIQNLITQVLKDDIK